jgi:biopolymer transport protein ExbD
MKLKKRRDIELDVEMTPMIDMVFLLLIFFMTAATMSQVDLTPEVELPIAPKASVPDDMRNRGTVNLLPLGSATPQGEIVSEEKPFLVGGRLVTDTQLTGIISERTATEPTLQVYMRVDRKTDFKYVRRGIKACADAGVFDVIFASFQSSGGG